ncbi:MAG: leucine--tRNA ligase [Flavobacteriales bacterium]|nr:leucine--tRNA ligase [Flavobacteriales bacterium]
MDYPFNEIEKKWQKYWDEHKTFAASNHSNKPKYYVLDMFPYPSGAGLHVGHPLGYIASDIVARYKRLQGYNVLHPMGFDAFGLPAEQYAIQTGKHPAETTAINIKRYIEQLKNIGFAYDWDRMVNTSDPQYYRWTQWIFLQLFHHWYDRNLQKARPILELIRIFEQQGNQGYHQQMLSGNVEGVTQIFTADEWKGYSEQTKQNILMNYRLAYQSFAYVNWCEALGTVLANDEVKDGVSERGGHPVERRQMRQWFLRITEYADRLYEDLDQLDWSDSMKEMQRNWIGKSEGLLIRFALKDHPEKLDIFTTRPDTIFGVSFMVLAPESEWVTLLTTANQKEAVSAYVNEAKNRSERERQADVKRVTGVFTGSYAIHPFTRQEIPIWISEYVLAGYGTGAVMAVPAHDGRDFRFAKHFGLPIPRVIAGPDGDNSEITEEAYEAKEGTVINSDFITGFSVKEAMEAVKRRIEELGLGERQVNYRLRDANFSRQRYWGEPFPIYFKNNIATPIPLDQLPLKLPPMDDFKPTGNPEGPLAKLPLEQWNFDGYPLETDTMPGFAGSSWYFLRYMDPQNPHTFASKEALDYWKDVDMYIGGTEHAVGHLLYSRFWHKFLYDLGYVSTNEPFKKLVNQGMIQGRSNFVYRVKGENKYVSLGLKDQFDTIAINVDVNYVQNDELNLQAAKEGKLLNLVDADKAEWVLEDGKYICGWEVEKMSKSKWNVVNPDQICEDYGADTLRMYEMFLGPIEQSKPWNTQGIEGVHKFLRKLWRTCIGNDGNIILTEDEPTAKELKTLHKTIKKIKEDIETLSLNTSISAFMICLNELTDLNCRKKAIFEPFLIILSPFAPHICEEIWHKLGHNESIAHAQFPEFNEKYLVENTFNYPVSFNGKVRYNIELPLGIPNEEVERAALNHELAAKWMEGKTPKKVIVVPGRIVNVVM